MACTAAYTQKNSSSSATCPACGSLECLCRPRFFAGQLLTEADLQALDRYIVEKNKLHNRYLHGDGVVCGLEVVCHSCKGWVTIKQGYALDPCGNDLIVCQDYSFNICDYIRRCCDYQRNQWECQPMASPPPVCNEAEQNWLVTLRYRESESRGIAALKPATPGPRCPQCGCNGAASSAPCTCGCHSSSGTGTTTQRCAPSMSPSYPPGACEPTRICEGFTVEVIPAPTDEPTFAQLFAGTFLEQCLECFSGLSDLAASLIKLQSLTDPNAIYQAATQWQSDVWKFLSSHPLTRCDLLKALSETPPIPKPDPNQTGGYLAAVDEALIPYMFALILFLLECFCSALLPPCRTPGDSRVILASVKVKGTDCQITTICNLARRFVWTWPNAFYWFSLGPVFHGLLEYICCTLFAGAGRDRRPFEVFPILRESRSATAAAPASAGSGATPGSAAAAAGSTDSPAGPFGDTVSFTNFEKLLSTIPFFSANSAKPADPVAFLKTAAPAFAQALVGLASGPPQGVAASLAQLGEDSSSLPKDLKANPQPVNWPLELWALQTLAQQFLPLGTPRTVAYTAGNTVVGFGAQSPEDLRAQVSKLQETLAQHQAILDRIQQQSPK